MATPYKGIVLMECAAEDPCKDQMDAQCLTCLDVELSVLDLEGKVRATTKDERQNSESGIQNPEPPASGADIDTTNKEE